MMCVQPIAGMLTSARTELVFHLSNRNRTHSKRAPLCSPVLYVGNADQGDRILIVYRQLPHILSVAGKRVQVLLAKPQNPKPNLRCDAWDATHSDEVL
jgi:hypothetical protein